MTSAEFEEKLRKLVPVSAQQAQLAWRLYAASEGQERQETDELLDVLLFQRIQKPRWTPENRPSIDTSKPATTGVATETVSG